MVFSIIVLLNELRIIKLNKISTQKTEKETCVYDYMSYK